MTTYEPASSGVTVDLAVPVRALAIGAHPDDVEFGCGATLAKWAAAGCTIHHLILTDGSKGTWDPEEDIPALVRTRQAEQRAASIALGGTGDVTFLRSVDGELASGLRQVSEVAYVIRKVRPTVILGHDPWKRYRLHPDHRNAGFLTTDGIVAARDPFFFAEQGKPPWRPEALLLWEADEADHVERTTGFEDVKIAALVAHASQHRSTMGIADADRAADVDAFATRVRTLMAAAGALAGVPSGEAFKKMVHL